MMNHMMGAQQASQAQGSSAIDFRTMLAQERQRSQQTTALKQTTAVNVFNMLQDMRHLLILDMRSKEAFDSAHIRKSLNTTEESFKDELHGAMLSYNDPRFRSHYQGDDLTRVLFIFPSEHANRMQKAVSEALPDALKKLDQSSGKAITIHKMFFLKDFEQSFQAKYPLVCLPSGPVADLQDVRANSRFPSEIKKDALYLGNMTNILNRDYFQLTMLGVKTVFYLTQGPFADIDQHFNCIHVQTNEMEKPELDFDELSQQVQELMKNPETAPVLLLCVSGQLSGALAIKVCMDTNASFASHPQVASTYVMQRRHELKDIEPWLFSQVKPVQPKKQKSTPLQMPVMNQAPAACEEQKVEAQEEVKE